MKKINLSFLLLLPLVMIAQIPSYYNNVDITLKGNELKNVLAKKIYDTHYNLLSYSKLWEVLKKSDLDPKNSNNVLLVYGWDDNDNDSQSDRTRNKEEHGAISGTDWNREHIFSRSLGTPELGFTLAGSDAHHIRACDITQNIVRNNRKFEDGNGIESYITANGNWYPGDEWKGDIARMIMYLYLRYPKQCLPINVGVGNPISTDLNMIDLFLKWNIEDPVNAFEQQRNSVIKNEQGNRNPFIDNPAFATLIWGGDQAENKFNNYTNTEKNNGTTTKLLISEYVEGSEYNKAIEIANYTGETIDLSKYSLKKASNGIGYFNSKLELVGSLKNNSVYVIVNNNASEEVSTKADLMTKSTVMDFNGNDAIGLFHNNELIDLIGDPQSSNSFGKDKTLQRKSSVKSPNTTYTENEWYFLNNNDISGLKKHNIDNEPTLGYNTQMLNNNRKHNIMYPNPVSTNNRIHFNFDNYNNTYYTIYDSSGKILQKGKIKKSIPALFPTGVYFINITTPQSSFTQKIIKQ